MQTELQGIQDEFIAKLVEQKALTSVFLINGIQLKGIISQFDQYTIVLNNEPLESGKKQIVYKHAISTIGLPAASVSTQISN